MNLVKQIKTPKQLELSGGSVVEEIAAGNKHIERLEELQRYHADELRGNQVHTQISVSGPDRPAAIQVKRIHIVTLIQESIAEARASVGNLERHLKHYREC